MKKEIPFYKRKWFMWVAAIIVLLAFLPQDDEEKAETPSTSKVEAPATPKPQAEVKKVAVVKAVTPAPPAVESDELRITKAARKAFGDGVVKSVVYVDGINVAMIAINEPIVLSANSDRKQFLLAVRETIQDIADMDGLKGVDVQWKDGDMRLMELRFEGDAIARAAKATHVDDLTTIAGTYWAHSGF